MNADCYFDLFKPATVCCGVEWFKAALPGVCGWMLKGTKVGAAQTFVLPLPVIHEEEREGLCSGHDECCSLVSECA